MKMKELTGIERELVLQYLIDGNVPVTVTPLEDAEIDKSGEEIRPSRSAVFPIAIKPAHLKVVSNKSADREDGIIFLTNPPENVKDFIGKTVRVEFYFHRLGLYFETELRQASSALALVIPNSISRIEDEEKKRPGDFSAEIYYSMSTAPSSNDGKPQGAGRIQLDCFPCEGYDIFSKPVWKDIDEGAQTKAKLYLEQFIAQARKQGVAGSGLQLIPVVRYLAERHHGQGAPKLESIEGRGSPLDILFVNHERIVFGARSSAMVLVEGSEYALEMNFPLGGNLPCRKVFTTCRVETEYKDVEGSLACAVCGFTSVREEDLRFLYEKCTNEKFV